MKIGQGIHTSTTFKTDNRVNAVNSDANKDFSDFLQQEGKRQSREIFSQLLKEIDEQGEKVITSRNFRELKAYKNLIKKFMEEALKAAILLDEQYSRDRLGRTKRFKIIKEIDKKLLELTNLTLQNETNQIKILDEIGEIRGLLINLYF